MTHPDPYLIIGLAGRAGAGKDTVADMLCQADKFYRYAFADPLRAEITASFGIDPELFSRPYKERRTPMLAIGRSCDGEFIRAMTPLGISITDSRSPREIMRWWGTEYRRRQCPTYWINFARAALDEAFRGGYRRVVFTDIRFRNEAEFTQLYGGHVWRIDRPNAKPQPADHESEEGVDDIQADVAISNDGTLVALASAVMRTYTALSNVEVSPS